MNKVRYIFVFAAGIMIGSVVTGRYVKMKYEQIAQDEIDSVKKAFSQKSKKEVDDSEESRDTEVRECEDIIRQEGYRSYSNIAGKYEKEGGSEPMDKPYVIAPEEFGEMPGYEEVELTYYADGILADDCNDIVEDVEDVVGADSLTHFGEYEDDSVFVRNDRLKCDYEILLDRRNYSDVLNSGPHRF